MVPIIRLRARLRFRAPLAVFMLLVFLAALVSASGLVSADCQDDCCRNTSPDDLCVAFCCAGLTVTAQSAYRLPEPSGRGLPPSGIAGLPSDGIHEPPFRPPAHA